jgi:hypothetical protein
MLPTDLELNELRELCLLWLRVMATMSGCLPIEVIADILSSFDCAGADTTLSRPMATLETSFTHCGAKDAKIWLCITVWSTQYRIAHTRVPYSGGVLPSEPIIALMIHTG